MEERRERREHIEKPEKSFEIPKPVTVGDEVEVTIESVGGQGDGIAKVSGFVIFVKGAAKGENVRIRITDVKRTYATGEKIGAASAPAASKAEEESEEEGDEAEAEEQEGEDGESEG